MKVYQKIATLIHDQTNPDDTEKVIAQCLHKTGLQSKFSIGPNTDPEGRYFSLWIDFAHWDVEVCVFPDLRFGFEIQQMNRAPPFTAPVFYLLAGQCRHQHNGNDGGLSPPKFLSYSVGMNSKPSVERRITDETTGMLPAQASSPMTSVIL